MKLGHRDDQAWCVMMCAEVWAHLENDSVLKLLSNVDTQHYFWRRSAINLPAPGTFMRHFHLTNTTRNGPADHAGAVPGERMRADVMNMVI